MKNQHFPKFFQNKHSTQVQKEAKVENNLPTLETSQKDAPETQENTSNMPAAPYGKLELLSAPAQSSSHSSAQFVPLSQGVGPAERLHEAQETLKHL